MSQRAMMMFASGAGVVALALLLPVGEINPRMTPLLVLALALPWLALLAAIRFPRPALSHGAFPLSLVPAIIHVPELHAHPGWSGPGGAISIVAIIALLAAFFRATAIGAPTKHTPLKVCSRFATIAGLTHLLAILGILVPVGAIWLPFLAEPTPPPLPSLLLGTAFSLIYVTVVASAVERIDMTGLMFDPVANAHFRSNQMTLLLQRRRRVAFGLTVAILTAMLGLIWYVRRGLA